MPVAGIFKTRNPPAFHLHTHAPLSTNMSIDWNNMCYFNHNYLVQKHWDIPHKLFIASIALANTLLTRAECHRITYVRTAFDSLPFPLANSAMWKMLAVICSLIFMLLSFLPFWLIEKCAPFCFKTLAKTFVNCVREAAVICSCHSCQTHTHSRT